MIHGWIVVEDSRVDRCFSCLIGTDLPHLLSTCCLRILSVSARGRIGCFPTSRPDLEPSLRRHVMTELRMRGVVVRDAELAVVAELPDAPVVCR